ncbi:sulfide/dihydroorotate dehydrogenase-like FAD/NAD-binding protein [Tissierella creatinophila]|uniref:Dihydroorotate dehydrogenase B (NAD(+)), electron transfer subunit n=1 Tax=Tissierella creatinophila DSM 6911 TaxID=1123403 RepID=A0A1U7M706_TISCR|nr:sulfide/dihydroorotate dehydrogenase-like FAD/NAD-binding protein [Tissierella creatinophila]OLS02978.1 dihydroorotate dehydrogenase B (NAD(+)), electron transfer subunit [Tissierella creatinophila DSM 6911]
MYEIIGKQLLAPKIYSLDILAPRVAKSALPGQFVIVIVDDNGERIPLTICDSDKQKGTVNIVIQTSGASTKKLTDKEIGDTINDFVGPLGKPSEFIYEELENLKTQKILLVGGGVGVAPLLPQAKWLKERGVDVHIVTGSRNKEFIILEDRFREITQNLFIATDDGSYGFHGMVTHAIEELVNRGNHYDRCIAIGPMIMMKFTAMTTKKLNIPTVVSLNPIMIDGTGMCGACRVTVDKETKFACVDGPEFDGHLVDFDEALMRQSQYKEEEKEINHKHCRLTGGMF